MSDKSRRFKKSEFLKSVTATQFRTPDGVLVSKVGNPWPEGKKVAIITAWNPNFNKASASQNKRKNAALKTLLKNKGKRFQIINAWWPDGTAYEESFVIENVTHQEARTICLRYRQDGYFWGNKKSSIRLILLK